eukprot:10035293-Alexandrium_andersonii.AAC.1
MALGPCTCGGWYMAKKRSSVNCPSPEGPARRSLRLGAAAVNARAGASRAVAERVINVGRFLTRAGLTEDLARAAAVEAAEAK